MVVMEGFRIFTYNTMSGKIWATVPAVDPAWEIQLGSAGSLSCSIPVRAEELVGLDMRTGTAENRMSLGVSYGQNILVGGPILERDNDADPGMLNISAEGIGSIFSVRKLLPKWAQLPEAQNIPSAVLKLPEGGPGLSLRGLIRELVRVGMENPPWNSGRLPVVLPPIEYGGPIRTYYGYDLKWIGDVMNDISAEEGGPEFRFRPRFRPNAPTYVEYVLEIGDPYLRQTGPHWKWDGTVPETGVIGFGTVSDGRKMAARAWRPGQGQEKDQKLGVATNKTVIDQGMPWMERDEASKQEANQETLTSLAKEDVRNGAAPMQQFSITVDTASTPSLGSYSPGDWADVRVPEGHPIIPGGRVTVRIMAISGDASSKVKIGVAPILSEQTGSAYPARIHVGSNDTPLAPYPAVQQFPGYNLFPQNETEEVI